MTEARAVFEAAFDVAAPKPGVPSWVHLLPLGRVDARDDRRWLLTDPKAVIAATKAYANGAPLPIDFEHQTEHAKTNGRPAPAAGWMTDFDARSDGIWARVDWTEAAAKMLAAKEYRFISPYFAFSGATGEITRIYHAGLTNTPALTLTALASSERPMTIKSEVSDQLRQLLGLADNAPDDAIVEAVRGLTTHAGATASPDRFVPIEVFEKVTAELNRTTRGVSQEAAEIAVDREIAAGRMVPALKDWGVALCTANKPAFDSFIERTAGPIGRLFTQTGAANRHHGEGAAKTELDAEIAANLGHAPKTRA